MGRRAVYKEERAGLHSPGSLRLVDVCSDFRSGRAGKRQEGSPVIGKTFGTQCPDQLSGDLGRSSPEVVYIRRPLHSASNHPHICATVHHGDQRGRAACPFAAFGDGGVPPVSGSSLCLQGRPTGAPPPLRPVWHHRGGGGGGGGLLQSGGGAGPPVVLADRGEPEEEHQVSPFIIGG